MKNLFIAIILILLASCAGLSEREEKTVYVANDYLVYQSQRFQKMPELIGFLSCDESVDLFISPLVNTKKERFSNVVADLIKMCGEPKIITIQVDNSVI